MHAHARRYTAGNVCVCERESVCEECASATRPLVWVWVWVSECHLASRVGVVGGGGGGALPSSLLPPPSLSLSLLPSSLDR